MFPCPSCSKQFPAESALSRHITRVQSETVKCLHCSKNFTHGSYRNHLNKLSRKKGWTCDHCDKEITGSREALTNHIHVFHRSRKKLLECKLCHMGFRWAGDLHRHKIKVHSKNASTQFVCDQCENVYVTHCALSKHMLKVHLGRQLSCKLCERKFGYAESLKSHLKKHHDDGLDCFQCDVCSRSYTLKESILQHIQFKHQGRERATVVCDICDARFEEKRTCLTAHMKTHGAAREAFTCDHCQKKHNEKANLLAHVKSFHLNCPFLCDNCLFQARNREQLTTHIFRKHLESSERKTLCPECNEWFGNIYQHTRHVHNAWKRVYICDTCDKQLSDSHEMARHCLKEMKLSKRLKCNICGKVLHSDCGFRRHFRQHSDKRKWFCCDFYDKRFLSKMTIVAHVVEYDKCN